MLTKELIARKHDPALQADYLVPEPRSSQEESSRQAVVFPQSLLLGALRDDRLTVVDAFQVTISREDGMFVAQAPGLNEFGWGETSREAIDDLQRGVANLYTYLSQNQEQLGPDLARVWGVLREHVAPRQLR